MEQRAVIKYHVKLGKKASETYRSMRQVYGDDCLSRTVVFEWHKRFLGGRESLEDDKYTGRPISVRTPESIQKVRDFLAQNSNASLRMMEEALNINKETIRTILQKDLGKTKVREQKLGVQHSKDNATNDDAASRKDLDLMKQIITDNEILCSQQIKHQSAEIMVKDLPLCKKRRHSSSFNTETENNSAK